MLRSSVLNCTLILYPLYVFRACLTTLVNWRFLVNPQLKRVMVKRFLNSLVPLVPGVLYGVLYGLRRMVTLIRWWLKDEKLNLRQILVGLTIVVLDLNLRDPLTALMVLLLNL